MSSEPGMGGSWGPSHQYLPPPGQGRARWRWPWLVVAVLAVWADRPLALLVLLVVAVVGLAWACSWWWLRRARAAAVLPEALAEGAEALRERSRRLGGGAYLGVADGEWVCADPEHAVLVLGPPRSGKTSSIVIPSVLAGGGAGRLDGDQVRCVRGDAAGARRGRPGLAVRSLGGAG